MDAAITPAVAKAAGSAVSKVLGGLVPGMVREARRRRVVRRAVRELMDRPPKAIEEVVEQLSPPEVARLKAYVGLPDFEQFAIQLTGLTLQRKHAAKHVADLRVGLARSLRLHGIRTASTETVADALMNELWSAVVVAIGYLGPPTHPGEIPGTTMTVSTRAAAAARNCELLDRIRTLADIQAFTSSIRSQISKVEGFVRPPHLESGRRVRLAQLYVEPRLAERPGSAETTGLTLKDILAKHLRTVVLGDPGGGKSTLAASLACRIANSTATSQREVVPFLVVVRDYATRLEREQISIAQYLRAMAAARYQIEPTADCIEFLLLNRRAVVIFDGLDELLDTSARRRVTEAVEAFTYAYPTTTVLVTSRRVGYEQAPLDAALFSTFHLLEFDDDQINAYAGKWFALDSTFAAEEQRRLAQSFLQELEHASDLRRNPLMLALICALYRGEGYIPRNRLDVYERCAIMLFERWDKHRGIRVPLPFDQHVRPAVWQLALWMFTNNTNPAATERELVSVIRRFLLRKRFEDPDEAEAAATAFVGYCRSRAWVLTEVGTSGDGEPLFAFTHRTFLEYFAANQLVRINPGPGTLFEALRPRIHSAEWDVVAQLAVLLLDRNVDGGADQFLQLLVEDAETRTLDERTPSLAFAAHLLSYVVPAPQVRRRLFDACWRLAASIDGDAPGSLVAPEEPRRTVPIAWLLAATEENREAIATMIREQVRADSPAGLAPLLAVTLDQVVCDIDQAVDQLVPGCRSFWYGESTSNYQHVRAILNRLAPTNTWAAVELTFSGDWSVSKLINEHGAAAACEEPPRWATYRRAPIILQEVLAGHTIQWSKWRPFVGIDPRAGTWAAQLAAGLPHAPAPWARLSRIPWWDMTVRNPTNTVPPGSPAFEVMVLCACLVWEARSLARTKLRFDIGPDPLPSWLTLPPTHPLSLVMRNATDIRCDLDTTTRPPIPADWLSPSVRLLLDRWAAREVDLIDDELTS